MLDIISTISAGSNTSPKIGMQEATEEELKGTVPRSSLDRSVTTKLTDFSIEKQFVNV